MVSISYYPQDRLFYIIMGIIPISRSSRRLRYSGVSGFHYQINEDGKGRRQQHQGEYLRLLQSPEEGGFLPYRGQYYPSHRIQGQIAEQHHSVDAEFISEFQQQKQSGVTDPGQGNLIGIGF